MGDEDLRPIPLGLTMRGLFSALPNVVFLSTRNAGGGVDRTRDPSLVSCVTALDTICNACAARAKDVVVTRPSAPRSIKSNTRFTPGTLALIRSN